MPRSLKEWIGATPDAKVPPRVRLRIWRRQCGDDNFCICPLSSLPLRATDDRHLDHEKALIEGGEHRESNLRFVHVAAHREKTADEVARKARVDAHAKSHLGIRDGVTALAGRDRETRSRAADARRADRTPAGKPPVPPVRLPPGFVTASER